MASNVVQQVLKAGYKVRGTARSAQKLAVLSKRWNAEFGEGSFEAVVVEDLAVEGALDTAMQGALSPVPLESPWADLCSSVQASRRLLTSPPTLRLAPTPRWSSPTSLP